MKRISTEQYEKYAEALKSQPGFLGTQLTDKQLVNQDVKQTIKNRYQQLRRLHNEKQLAQEEDLDV